MVAARTTAITSSAVSSWVGVPILLRSGDGVSRRSADRFRMSRLRNDLRLDEDDDAETLTGDG